MANVPTEANIKALAEEKAKRAAERQLAREKLEKVAEAVQGAEAVIAAKANEQGHLFGSVTAPQIAANLREQGFKVADGIVHLPEHIKEVGTHAVTLKFRDDLTVTVNVVVVPEQQETAETDETDETNKAHQAQKL